MCLVLIGYQTYRISEWASSLFSLEAGCPWDVWLRDVLLEEGPRNMIRIFNLAWRFATEAIYKTVQYSNHCTIGAPSVHGINRTRILPCWCAISVFNLNSGWNIFVLSPNLIQVAGQSTINLNDSEYPTNLSLLFSYKNTLLCKF